MQTELAILPHKIRNLIHSILLIGGMMLLSLALGWCIAGGAGVVLLGLAAGFLLGFAPRLSPTFLLRMYGASRLTPERAPRLLAIVAELTRRAGLPRVPPVYYIPTQVMNAFTLGTRREAVLGVTDGLLRRMNVRDITAIIAHEMAHVRNNDGWVMSLADFVTRIVGAFSWTGQMLLLLNLPLLLVGAATVSWTFIFLLIFAPTLSALLQLALSRSREFEADLGAVELTRDPRGLAVALTKLEKIQAGFFERIFLPGRRVPGPSLLRTHPPTEERVSRLLEVEKDLQAEPMGAEPIQLSDLQQLGHPVLAPPRWRVTGIWR